MAVYDDIVFEIIKAAEADLENRPEANVLYVSAEIRMNIFSWFRESVEKLASSDGKRRAIAVVLTTPGRPILPLC